MHRFWGQLAFALSCFVHGAIVVVYLFLPQMEGWWGKNKSEEQAISIENTIRVDVVALPENRLLDEAPQEQKSSQVPEQPSPPQLVKPTLKIIKREPLTPEHLPEKENVVKVKVENKEALSEEKKEEITAKKTSSAFSLIASLSEKNIPESAEKTKPQVAKKKKTYAGNQLSQGVLDRGENSQAFKADHFMRYAKKISELVRSHWYLPSHLKKKVEEESLRCRIKIYINARGQLLRHEFIEESSSSEFNTQALEAIKLIGRFPEADPSIEKALLAGRIVLGFPM